jgi:tRNA-(ms[2]io[6]A)-hydroxylase
MTLNTTVPTHLQNFLKIATPDSWCEAALKNFDLLLIDHAHCERKAAATVLQFITKNPHHEEFIRTISPIAREELLHFEKMLRILKKRNIKLQPLAPSEYGKRLHSKRAQACNQQQFVDDLMIAAIIEARSCERFFCLLPYIETRDEEVFKFYEHLANAEQRHFEVYIEYAKKQSKNFEERLNIFLSIENNYILEHDKVFRFHSGVPC